MTIDKKTIIPVACALGGLLIGYFAGREHLKMQMASMFMEASADITKGMRNIAKYGSPDAPSETKATSNKEKIISGVLLKKEFAEGKRENTIEYTIKYENVGDKKITSAEGVLEMQDNMGNVIIKINDKIEDPLAVKESVTVDRYIIHNRFRPEHAKLVDTDVNKIFVFFDQTKVLYEDGTLETF